MDLKTANQRFQSVSEQTLEEVFADDEMRGEFVILESGNNNFLQAGGEREGPYVLEVMRDGVQFQAVGDLTKQDVKGAFLAYFRGEPDWRSKWEWKKLEQKKGCFKRTVMLLLAFCGSIWLLLLALGLAQRA